MRMAKEYDGWAYITTSLSTLAQLSLFTGMLTMTAGNRPQCRWGHTSSVDSVDGSTGLDQRCMLAPRPTIWHEF